MYCEMCGAVNDDNAKKCKKCGFSFTDSADSTKEEFTQNVEKFKEDNYETIRKKSQAEKVVIGASNVAKSTGKTVGKFPLPVKILACLAIVVGIVFGVYYYIQTNNFFVPEKNEQTGETYYVYYKSGYKILDAPLYLRGKHYRVDASGKRMDDEVYVDNDGNSYYYGVDGVMKENEWFDLDGERKYADDNGIILMNQWWDEYYLDNEGNITYDKEIGDYYVGGDGKRVKNTWMNDHFYGSDGLMLKNTRSTDEQKLKLDQNGNIIYDPTIQIHSKNYRFGSTIVFGAIEQDGNEANGPEPIEWILLRGHQDEALLLAKDVLLAKAYQIEEYSNTTNNEWKNSYVKNWLNGHFYGEAFDDIDKKFILSNDEDLGTVFAPSIHELETFLPNQRFRIAFPSKVANIATEKSVVNKEAAIYWLRDDGKNPMHKAFVTDIGDIVIDDTSDKIALSNYYNSDISVNGHSGTSDLSDILKDLGYDLAEEALEAVLPGWLAKIINKTGLTKSVMDIVWDILGLNPIDKEKIKDLPKIDPGELDDNLKMEDLLDEKIPERVVENPYKNVGLITNQFVGVRPMIIVNMGINR